MRKYEDVDVIACLGSVLEINTEYYRSDFKYDAEMFADAAKQPDGENNYLVWLSRQSGTECFRERDVYLIESQAHNSWTYHAENRSDTIRAYAVEVKRPENGRIVGDLYELDYREHMRHVKDKAFHVVAVSLKYADGTELHMPYKEWDGERERLYRRHGEIMCCRREPKPEDVDALNAIIGSARAKRYKDCRPAAFKVGIHNPKERTAAPTAVKSNNREVGFSGWEFEGGRAEANADLNRLQLFFDERPDKDKHSALRHAGFVYSHTNGAYQRQLNDGAIYAAGRLNFVKPADGRTVREHRPKAPSREDAAR